MWLRRAAVRIGGFEPGITALAAPLLLFPTWQPALTAGALIALLLVWILRWVGTGRPGDVTPLNVSLLALVVMIPFGVWASAFPAVTLPKLTGLILGVAAFRAMVHAVHDRQGILWAVAAFLAVGLGFATLSLVGTNWMGKLPGLESVLARIPRLVEGLPGAEGGINPNELGGTLLLFLPVALAASQVRVAGRPWVLGVVRLGALAIALFLGGILLFSQSRSAWIGAAAGLGAMVWFRWRRARWLLVCTVVVLALGLLFAGPADVIQSLFGLEGGEEAEMTLGSIGMEGRLELWSRALYAIQDLPFTGCGLGAFRRVVPVLYPLFLIGPDMDIGHAHNVFLQVALDLGLPGLVAYLALVGTAFWLCWRIMHRGDGEYRWLTLGIMGALVAFHVYGLADAIALGARPGLALWMLLALSAILWTVGREAGMVAVLAAEPSGVEGA